MIELAPRNAQSIAPSRLGVQPIAVAAVALILVVLGIGSIAVWRSYTGNAPETDRVVASRLGGGRHLVGIERRLGQALARLQERRHDDGHDHLAVGPDLALREVEDGHGEDAASVMQLGGLEVRGEDAAGVE